MCVNKREGASEKSDAVPVTAGLQFVKSMFLFQNIFRLVFFVFCFFSSFDYVRL